MGQVQSPFVSTGRQQQSRKQQDDTRKHSNNHPLIQFADSIPIPYLIPSPALIFAVNSSSYDCYQHRPICYSARELEDTISNAMHTVERMKYLLKPWLMALLIAVLLHGAFFAWYEDRHWFTFSPLPQHSRLRVSLLADSEATHTKETTPAQEADATVSQDMTEPQDMAAPTVEAIPPSPPVNKSVSPPVKPLNDASSTTNGGLQPVPKQTISGKDWKQNSLLDIGKTRLSEQAAVDPNKDAFSAQLRQALAEAKRVQKEYLKGVVKPTRYPITEDADGTQYVNIKGVCWKLPEPGSEEAWQIVLSGCSGQTDVFHFELHITTDLLTPEQLEMLPFGGE